MVSHLLQRPLTPGLQKRCCWKRLMTSSLMTLAKIPELSSAKRQSHWVFQNLAQRRSQHPRHPPQECPQLPLQMLPRHTLNLFTPQCTNTHFCLSPQAQAVMS